MPSLKYHYHNSNFPKNNTVFPERSGEYTSLSDVIVHQHTDDDAYPEETYPDVYQEPSDPFMKKERCCTFILVAYVIVVTLSVDAFVIVKMIRDLQPNSTGDDVPVTSSQELYKVFMFFGVPLCVGVWTFLSWQVISRLLYPDVITRERICGL